MDRSAEIVPTSALSQAILRKCAIELTLLKVENTDKNDYFIASLPPDNL